MGGGLMQLVAYGAQDIYLSGNPQITFFKVVYRRHTNFSMESIEQTFNGSAGFDRKVTCTISRNGDLISRIYLQAEVPNHPHSAELNPLLDAASDAYTTAYDAYTAANTALSTALEALEADDGTGGAPALVPLNLAVSTTTATLQRKTIDLELARKTLQDTLDYKDGFEGHKLIKSVEIEIGGQRIDKHYGDWLHIWNELTQTMGHWDGYKEMTSINYDTTATPGFSTLYIPLQFWFCRNPGLALPLIALQYHEVKINIEFASKSVVYGTAAGAQPSADISSSSLFVDYIYLDTDERRRFAQVSHEYLIEQLQFTGDETATAMIRLNFNHPVKEIVWVEQASPVVGKYVTSYTDAKLQLNGHERFSVRKPSYFQLVQPYQHHEHVPSNGHINVYSFALKPEEHQPSGTCNMSRIDNATLNLSQISASNTVKVFAVNYNVLRVMSGMGGLAYSN
jgi:hypothetical protein